MVPGNFLSPGSYSIMVAPAIPGFVLFDILENFSFSIEDTGSIASALGDRRWGVVTPLLTWEHDFDGLAAGSRFSTQC